MPDVDLRNISANAVVTGYRAIGGVLNSVKMTDGQILVGDTGHQPVATTITSDGSVVITGGPGTLQLTVSRRCAVTLSCGATSISTNPSYYSAGDASTTDFGIASWMAPYAGIASKLYIYRTANPATTPTDTLRYFDGSNHDSTLAATFVSTQSTASDLTHTVSLPAGAIVEMKSTETVASRHAATFQFEATG